MKKTFRSVYSLQPRNLASVFGYCKVGATVEKNSDRRQSRAGYWHKSHLDDRLARTKTDPTPLIEHQTVSLY